MNPARAAPISAVDSFLRESAMPQDGVMIERVDHIGIRVRDFDRALDFYRRLGFELAHKVTFDAVAIIKNQAEVVWPLETMDYGQKEFGVRDCDGYTLAFAEALEGE